MRCIHLKELTLTDREHRLDKPSELCVHLCAFKCVMGNNGFWCGAGAQASV